MQKTCRDYFLFFSSQSSCTCCFTFQEGIHSMAALHTLCAPQVASLKTRVFRNGEPHSSNAHRSCAEFWSDCIMKVLYREQPRFPCTKAIHSAASLRAVCPMPYCQQDPSDPSVTERNPHGSALGNQFLGSIHTHNHPHTSTTGGPSAKHLTRSYRVQGVFSGTELPESSDERRLWAYIFLAPEIYCIQHSISKWGCTTRQLNTHLHWD